MCVCLIFGTSLPCGGCEVGRVQQQGVGERVVQLCRSTWVREPKPGSLGQDVPAGVCPCQVAVSSGVRGEDVGHRQHIAEQPAQGQPQQHLPVTFSSESWLRQSRISSNDRQVWDKAFSCPTLSLCTHEHAHGMEGE